MAFTLLATLKPETQQEDTQVKIVLAKFTDAVNTAIIGAKIQHNLSTLFRHASYPAFEVTDCGHLQINHRHFATLMWHCLKRLHELGAEKSDFPQIERRNNSSTLVWSDVQRSLPPHTSLLMKSIDLIQENGESYFTLWNYTE